MLVVPDLTSGRLGIGRKAVVLAVVLFLLAASALLLTQEFAGGQSTHSSSQTSSSSAASSASSTFSSSQASTASSSTTSATTVNSSTQSFVGDWPTYHLDNTRDGESTTPPLLSSPTTRWSVNVDRSVFAEPLIYHGLVFVATENDTVYALSVADGSVVWSRHLGTPLPARFLQCGDIDPVGITGTPVIDTSTGDLYVVAMINGSGYRLFALDSSTGQEKWSASVSPTGFDYTVEQQRGALLLAYGMVYVPFGGFAGDCGPYHGWLVGYPTNESGPPISYMVPSGRAAGIWTPAGPSADGDGFIYVVTGNSFSSTTFDDANAVIKLTPSLVPIAFFAPSNWAELNSGDTDLGSLGATLLQNGIIFQVGKEGVGYLLNSSDLGGVGGQLFSSRVCTSAFGSTAFTPEMIYVPCVDGLFALKVQTERNPSFSTGWGHSGFHSLPPIIAGGAVWTIDQDNATLLAFNAQTGAKLFSMPLGSVEHFTTPSAGEGLVVVAANTQIYALQLGS